MLAFSLDIYERDINIVMVYRTWSWNFRFFFFFGNCSQYSSGVCGAREKTVCVWGGRVKRHLCAECCFCGMFVYLLTISFIIQVTPFGEKCGRVMYFTHLHECCLRAVCLLDSLSIIIHVPVSRWGWRVEGCFSMHRPEQTGSLSLSWSISGKWICFVAGYNLNVSASDIPLMRQHLHSTEKLCFRSVFAPQLRMLMCRFGVSAGASTQRAARSAFRNLMHMYDPGMGHGADVCLCAPSVHACYCDSGKEGRW